MSPALSSPGLATGSTAAAGRESGDRPLAAGRHLGRVRARDDGDHRRSRSTRAPTGSRRPYSAPSPEGEPRAGGGLPATRVHRRRRRARRPGRSAPATTTASSSVELFGVPQPRRARGRRRHHASPTARGRSPLFHPGALLPSGDRSSISSSVRRPASPSNGCASWRRRVRAGAPTATTATRPSRRRTSTTFSRPGCSRRPCRATHGGLGLGPAMRRRARPLDDDQGDRQGRPLARRAAGRATRIRSCSSTRWAPPSSASAGSPASSPRGEKWVAWSGEPQAPKARREARLRDHVSSGSTAAGR